MRRVRLRRSGFAVGVLAAPVLVAWAAVLPLLRAGAPTRVDLALR